MNRAAEARRRRILRTLVASAVAAAIVPLLIHDGSVVAVLARCEAFVRECLQAVLHLSAAQWIPAALLLGGFLYAVEDLLRQARKVRRVIRLHRTRSPAPGEPIHGLAYSLGALGRVRLIDGPAPNPAFAAGLLRPRIYLAADLQHELRPEELRALFRHELWHLRRRDPLRFALLRALGRSFFWLPIVEALCVDLIEDAETLADDFAAEDADSLEVAGALVSVARRTGAALALAAGANGVRPIERRVRRLLDVDGVPSIRLPVRRLAVSLAVLVALWGTVAVGTTTTVTAAPSASLDQLAVHCPECGEDDMSHAGCRLLRLLTRRS